MDETRTSYAQGWFPFSFLFILLETWGKNRRNKKFRVVKIKCALTGRIQESWMQWYHHLLTLQEGFIVPICWRVSEKQAAIRALDGMPLSSWDHLTSWKWLALAKPEASEQQEHPLSGPKLCKIPYNWRENDRREIYLKKWNPSFAK